MADTEPETSNKQPVKKKQNWFAKHKILTGLGIFVLLVIIAGASGDKSKTTTTTKSVTKTSTSKPSEMAKVGQVARDGKFEFTVNKVTCGEKTVGTNQYLQKTAQGQYCRLNMTVKNIGNEAQSLFADNQKLTDAQGKQYSSDSTATLYAQPDGSTSTWYNDINPGNAVTGDIIYDIPAGVTPTVAILHDSAFSGGVKVSLQ